MSKIEVLIPPHIWTQLKKFIPKRLSTLVVDLKLRSGHVVKSMVSDEKGRVLGQLNGGREGISDKPLNFTSEDIVAARVAEGVFAWLGMTCWRK